MSGQYLNSTFALPCPPGIDVPPETVSPFTSNSLKVCLPENTVTCSTTVWIKTIQFVHGSTRTSVYNHGFQFGSDSLAQQCNKKTPIHWTKRGLLYVCLTFLLNRGIIFPKI